MNNDQLNHCFRMSIYYLLSDFWFSINSQQKLHENELLELLLSGVKAGSKYSEKARKFCLTLHYHSPRAYGFLRETFNNNLPHAKTIQNWYANSDLCGEPGIQVDHMAKLEKFAMNFRDEKGSDIYCSLVFDEMHIRRQVLWSSQHQFIGYINQEKDPNSQDRTISTQAILFILNGINVNLEFPVAYFFINTLNCGQRKDLVIEVVEAVSKCGINITNLTFDGYSSNIPMCQMLGAQLDIFSPEFQPFFKNPFSDNEIHIILDPCHMEKLVRNALAEKEVFYDAENGKIEWKFIESLHKFSKKNYFPMHKLSKKHIQWNRNQMDVRLAVQTLSESVAKSIEFLMKQGHPEFAEAGATVKFIRTMNTLFDIRKTAIFLKELCIMMIWFFPDDG